MSTVYITSNNGTLSESGEVLLYEDYKGNKTKLLPNKVTEILVIGKMTITSGAFVILLSHQISVVFIKKNGKYAGKLVYMDKKNTLLRHRQHIISADPDKSASIAKDIVRGKIHNQYLFMQRINRKNKVDGRFLEDSIKEVGRIRHLLENTYDINSIRGLEGDASRIYFSCFGMNIQSDWTSFTTRTKNPPLDPVNSVLSFLYTVLANKISGYIYELGLDSGIGTLHSVSYGRESLVYDLVEEFRTPLVDTSTCALFNLKIMKKEDFRVESVYDELEDDEMLEQRVHDDANAVLLTQDGMKIVLDYFEKKLETVHHYPLTGKALSFDKIIKEQVKLYKQVISGVMDHYLPMVVV